AGAENPFASDPYVRQWNTRSILCLPLVKQAALVGVLYLENNLARGVFTPARIESLTLLASQAALSLENARLYSEVQQAERNVRDILDLVPHHIAVATPDGTSIYVNRVMLDYYGLTPEDVQDSHIEGLARQWVRPGDRLGAPAQLRGRSSVPWRTVAFMHRDGVEPFLSAWGRGFAGTAPWETEARFRRRDGEYRWFLVRVIPLRDDGGRIVRWYITGTDIDDRKKAVEKIRQDERELRLLFDVVPQHIGLMDAGGRLLHANPAALEFWGVRTPEELNSNDIDGKFIGIAERYHPDDLT